MGRKSNDGNSSSSSSSSTSTVGATVMGLRMIQCGRQTVHVIQPDGQVRQFVVPVKVSDLLILYPHHLVSHATTNPTTTTTATTTTTTTTTTTGAAGIGGKRCSTNPSSVILPLDAYLETGSIYVLLPLPRLFPSAPPPTPHLCSCFFPSLRASEDSTGIGAIKAELKRHWSAGAVSSSKISPEDGSSGGGGGVSSPLLPRRLWEPALEIILEDRVLVLTNKELKENHKGKKLVSALHLKLRSLPSSSSSSSSSTT